MLNDMEGESPRAIIDMSGIIRLTMKLPGDLSG